MKFYLLRMLLEFLTDCTGWDPGFRAQVESEDPEYFYFNDVNDRWSCVEKTKEGEDFIVLSEEKIKQRNAIIELFEMSKNDEDFICGGEETTYNRLRERVKKLRDENKNNIRISGNR